MKPEYFLPPDTYTEVIRHTPLVAIDLVVMDKGRMLVGRRVNRPAQGTFFVPGGRICKGERFDEAFRRISHDELGVSYTRDDCQFLGIYDHMYSDSANDPNVNTHYITIAYRIDVNVGDLDEEKLWSQHSEVRTMSLSSLLNDHEVHENTKVYGRQLLTDYGFGGMR